MKTSLYVALWIVAMIGIALGILWFEREISYASVPVKVIEPEPGIHCALAVTHDGAAMACWPKQ